MNGSEDWKTGNKKPALSGRVGFYYCYYLVVACATQPKQYYSFIIIIDAPIKATPPLLTGYQTSLAP